MSNINWDIKRFMAAMKKEGGAAAFPVLMALWSFSNRRGRCYPGVRLLCKVTGYSGKPVTKALDYLEKAGAYILVPYDKRMEDEAELPVRQHIYELTGTVTVKGKKWNYLYLNPDVVLGETSPDETLPSTTEGISKTEGNAKKKTTTGAAAPQPRKRDPLFDAILEFAFSVKPDSDEGRVIAKERGSAIGKVKASLVEAGKTAGDVEAAREAWWAWDAREKPPGIWAVFDEVMKQRQPNGRSLSKEEFDRV